MYHVNCQNVIKIHTTKITEGKTNKNTTQDFGGNKYSKNIKHTNK